MNDVMKMLLCGVCSAGIAGAMIGVIRGVKSFCRRALKRSEKYDDQ